jgi:citrate lyase beta subunit
MSAACSPWQGACLYLPASHLALDRVARGKAVPGLRTAVVCLEDATHDSEVEHGLRVVKNLRVQNSGATPRLYLRPRSIEMLRQVIEGLSTDVWAGIVLPKLTARDIGAWLQACDGSTLGLMPILETSEVFDPWQLRDIVDALQSPTVRPKVDAVRIGATDLFSVLGTRRPATGTLYESALGPTVRQLASLLMSKGFEVSAPVAERIQPDEDFLREVELDVEGGFIGKTAVHPQQVSVINRAFQVTPAELGVAERILDGTQAVFAVRGVMSEARPHARWARRIVERADIFGVAAESQVSPGGAFVTTKGA